MLTEDNQRDILQNLPPVLKAIIRALGLERAQTLLLYFGGTMVMLPKYKSDKLGLTTEELTALHHELKPHLIDGNRITLPKIDKVFIAFRNIEIRAMRENKSLNALALQYNLSSRHIQNVCKVTEDKQTDLFDT